MTSTTTIKSLHEEIINKVSSEMFPDGTYDVKTLEAVSFEKGFQVTFFEIGMDYSDDEYEYIVNMFKEFSMDGNTYLGFFDGGAEISWRVKEKKTAKMLAKMFNQVSVWDWKHCKCIDTKGTGRKA